RTRRYDYGTICGILCGSMANPMALGYASDTTKGDTSGIAYASVYPLGMFIRVVIAQMLIVFFAS
ncbi:MAG: transporter, partial [Prevotella sp.]|nr:transporter [Prevotella sp.]